MNRALSTDLRYLEACTLIFFHTPTVENLEQAIRAFHFLVGPSGESRYDELTGRQRHLVNKRVETIMSRIDMTNPITQQQVSECLRRAGSIGRVFAALSGLDAG